MTILKDVPITIELEKCELEGFDQEKIIKLFQELEFKSLLSKVSELIKIDDINQEISELKKQENTNPKSEILNPKSYQLIDTEEEFENF